MTKCGGESVRAGGRESLLKSGGKELAPLVEDNNLVVAEPLEGFADFSYALFRRTATLGKKQVGERYDLFFDGGWGHISVGQRELLSGNVVSCEPDADMPFTNHGVAGETLLLEDFSP